MYLYLNISLNYSSCRSYGKFSFKLICKLGGQTKDKNTVSRNVPLWMQQSNASYGKALRINTSIVFINSQQLYWSRNKRENQGNHDQRQTINNIIYLLSNNYCNLGSHLTLTRIWFRKFAQKKTVLNVHCYKIYMCIAFRVSESLTAYITSATDH